MDSDMKVVQRVLAGDTGSFRILVDRHRDKLFGVLMRILADPQVADEVAQDTFIKAYTRLAGFRGESAFSTWLIQIGVHQARDYHRKRQRANRTNVISLEELRRNNPKDWESAMDHSRPDPQAELESQEKWQALESELAEIPASFREIFTLRHLENMEYEEISRITGDTIGTLKVRAHRARALLRTRMESRGFDLGSSTVAPSARLAIKQEGS